MTELNQETRMLDRRGRPTRCLADELGSHPDPFDEDPFDLFDPDQVDSEQEADQAAKED